VLVFGFENFFQQILLKKGLKVEVIHTDRFESLIGVYIMCNVCGVHPSYTAQVFLSLRTHSFLTTKYGFQKSRYDFCRASTCYTYYRWDRTFLSF